MTARSPSARRRARAEDIVDATRRLFDERGLQDAPIDRIARAAGINKALIYRHFASKEELYILTVTRYLDEVADELAAAVAAAADDPTARLRAGTEAFADYCLDHPAFLDCAMSLMRRPAADLRERVSEAVWLRLGRAMADCLRVSAVVLAEGARTGAFDVPDPRFTANHLYTQLLGTMHLARIGVGVAAGASGPPTAFAVEPGRVRAAAVAAALATVRA
jgi:AcrR family transcriptional regulator